MLNTNQFFIFAADSKNDYRTPQLRNDLRSRNIGFKEVSGAYTHDDGTQVSEKSFIVLAKYENEVLELAKKYEQESVLFVDSKSNASLIYTDGSNRFEKLGKFQKVNSLDGLMAWTYDKETDTSYSVI